MGLVLGSRASATVLVSLCDGRARATVSIGLYYGPLLWCWLIWCFIVVICMCWVARVTVLVGLYDGLSVGLSFLLWGRGSRARDGLCLVELVFKK